MRKWIPCVALATLLGAPVALSDTVYLKNGVRFDGVVMQRPDGNYQVKAGRRTLVYRPSEVESIEKNEKTGEFDREAAVARWEERNAELTELTGLTAEQRTTVEDLMYRLQRSDPAERKAVRDKLISLQQEMDVFKFLAWRMPGVSHRLSPWVLEAMFYVEPGRALRHLREQATHTYYGTRAKSLELLGRLGDSESVQLMARGLLDHAQDVQIMAAYALANARARQATPALIETLKNPDLRVSNASREALQALWAEQVDANAPPRTVDEWQAVWAANAGGWEAVALNGLQPLIDPEHEFQNE